MGDAGDCLKRYPGVLRYGVPVVWPPSRVPGPGGNAGWKGLALLLATLGGSYVGYDS